MIVTISRNITWEVVEFFRSQDFIVPDSMAKASSEEIIKYLEDSDQLADAEWDLVKDNWSGSKYDFVLEERDEIPEDEELGEELDEA